MHHSNLINLYTPKDVNYVAHCLVGSRLFGMHTEKSDYDYLCVYLPSSRASYLHEPLKTYKVRLNSNDELVPNQGVMLEGGLEITYVSVQTLALDFYKGQTYAVEAVFSLKNSELNSHIQHVFSTLVDLLIQQAITSNLKNMSGFAAKQVHDYVDRGARLKIVQRVLEKTSLLLAHQDQTNPWSLKTPGHPDDVTKTVADYILEVPGVEQRVERFEDGKVKAYLSICGRSYEFTTKLTHFHESLVALSNTYGERSTSASETGVDLKSLVHALRVYDELIEIVDTGKLRFPLANANIYRDIKFGHTSPQYAKFLLNQAIRMSDFSVLKKPTPELEEHIKTSTADVVRVLHGLLDGKFNV